jgi:hypothetical protein
MAAARAAGRRMIGDEAQHDALRASVAPGLVRLLQGGPLLHTAKLTAHLLLRRTFSRQGRLQAQPSDDFAHLGAIRESCSISWPRSKLRGNPWQIDSLAELGVSHTEYQRRPSGYGRIFEQLAGEVKSPSCHFPREARLWVRKGALPLEVLAAAANERKGRWAGSRQSRRRCGLSSFASLS